MWYFFLYQEKFKVDSVVFANILNARMGPNIEMPFVGELATQKVDNIQ